MSPASLDEALVAAAQGGSTEAFARLVERHQQALRAFLRRACGDWAGADDLAQETFIAAWSRIGRLRTGASVRAWLCGIGYNQHLTAHCGRACANGPARRGSGKRTPTATQAAPEDRLALEAAMADLPVEQRACVALCLAAEFSRLRGGRGAGPAARDGEESCDAGPCAASCRRWE